MSDPIAARMMVLESQLQYAYRELEVANRIILNTATDGQDSLWRQAVAQYMPRLEEWDSKEMKEQRKQIEDCAWPE